jgi:hypothetical protein
LLDFTTLSDPSGRSDDSEAAFGVIPLFLSLCASVLVFQVHQEKSCAKSAGSSSQKWYVRVFVVVAVVFAVAVVF